MAAAAIAAAQAAQANQGFGFLDELAGSDNTRDKTRIVSLVATFGYAWKDVNNRQRQSRQSRMKRIAAREQAIRVWDTPKSQAPDPQAESGQLGSKLDVVDEEGEEFADWMGGKDVSLGLAFQQQHKAEGFGDVDVKLLQVLEQAMHGTRDGEGLEDKEGTKRERLHRLCNDPDSSELAEMISLVVLITIVVSCLAILVESFPTLMHDNDTAYVVFFVLETICVSIFTMEFTCRIVSAPILWKFCVEPMNVIDLLAILPYYIAIMAPDVEISWLTILRMLRMVRVLRFAQKNETVNCVMLTLAASLDIAMFMLFMLTIVVIVFAAFVYNVERGDYNATVECYVRPGESDCSPFISIPEAMWVIMVTVMMVGYGEIVPTTVPGKFFASFACVIGIMCMALPVSVLGANFSTAMAASKQKSAKKELIENARFQGDQGMVSSCQKVLDKFEHFNNITAMCLDMGRETLQDTADQHAVLWDSHLRRISAELKGQPPQGGTPDPPGTPSTKAVVEKFEMLPDEDGEERMVIEVPKSGEQELFDLFCYSRKLQEKLSMSLQEVACHVTKASELCDQVGSSIKYVETLCKQPDMETDFEHQWDDTWAKLKQAQALCAQVATKYSHQRNA